MEERWIRVILDGGGSILLKGIGFEPRQAGPVMEVYGLDEVVLGCFPLNKVIAVVSEKEYVEGCKRLGMLDPSP